jgi:hypothetical protein
MGLALSNHFDPQPALVDVPSVTRLEFWTRFRSEREPNYLSSSLGRDGAIGEIGFWNVCGGERLSCL